MIASNPHIHLTKLALLVFILQRVRLRLKEIK